MKDLLGGKGSGLAEMTNAGLPVPPGFTISTEACTLYYSRSARPPRSSRAQMVENLRKLEKAPARFWVTSRIHCSCRSARARSSPCPGMMDTILNLGLNDRTVEGIKAKTGNGRFAWDSYRRFIQMFGNVVLEIPKDAFEHTLDAVKKEAGAKIDTDLTEKDLVEVVRRYKKVVRDKDEEGLSAGSAAISCAAPATQCSAPGTTRARSSIAASTASRTRSARPSTCRRWCSATWVTARRPASASREIRHRRERVLRRVPHQRPGRGRRLRRSDAAADQRAEGRSAEGLRGAAQDHVTAREALQGRPGLRVHDPGRRSSTCCRRATASGQVTRRS